MRAVLVIRDRTVFDDGAIIDIEIWRVPKAVEGSQHQLKYSFFYGRPGERLIGYDNERGKGDHRHYGAREESYAFTSIEKLLADFRADIERVRGAQI